MQQLPPAALQSWMADRSRDQPALLDVREPWEHELCLIAGSVPLPMSQVVDRAGELDPAREWVVICHHGMRSMQVGMYLERHGFPSVFNLQGGIDAWARELEPGMARY
jgi:rhodanese-related sulfurtransferase